MPQFQNILKKIEGMHLLKIIFFGVGCSNLYRNKPAFFTLKVNTQKDGKIEFTQ